MEEKINGRMFLIGILSILLTAGMMITVFHKVFEKRAEEDIRLTTTTLAVAYEGFDDYRELEKFAGNGLRITLIAGTGEVLFESDAEFKAMENHGQREEFVLAKKYGTGEAMRHSNTLEQNTYYYAVRMSDGNILRTAASVATMYADYNEAMPMIIVIGIIVMMLSVVLSQMLTKNLVKPIEDMAKNIDSIDKDIPYKELEPFALAVKEHHNKKEESAKMRQEFTANVSHELKTPLTSISGYAEMIENGMVNDTDIEKFAGKIHVEAKRLIELIGDILKLSELDEPNCSDAMEAVDLYQISKHTVEMLSLKASRTNIDISLEGESAIINGNRLMLGELIYNLCDNAIRYNKKDGFVKISVLNKAGKILVDIQDNGIGISKEYQDRIFERFFTVNKSRSKELGGTGLGLAIVKHIVIQHGGTIKVESQKDVGTTMHVVFKTE